MTADVRHLLIETQGSWNGPGAARFLQDAAALAGSGESVVVLLLQDGVFTALTGPGGELDGLGGLGVPVWVDDFSLAQRALPAGRLPAAAEVVGMDAVAGLLLAESCRVVWH